MSTYSNRAYGSGSTLITNQSINLWNSLTDLERRLYAALPEDGFISDEYDVFEYVEDCGTWVNVEGYAETLSETPACIKGILSSLVKKGLVVLCKPEPDGSRWLYFTETGYSLLSHVMN